MIAKTARRRWVLDGPDRRGGAASRTSRGRESRASFKAEVLRIPIEKYLVTSHAGEHSPVLALFVNVMLATQLSAWVAAGEAEGGIPVEIFQDVVSVDVCVHEGHEHGQCR